MYVKLLKTIKGYVKNGGFWAGPGDKNTMLLHKVVDVLRSCNLNTYIIYLPGLQDTFI